MRLALLGLLSSHSWALGIFSAAPRRASRLSASRMPTPFERKVYAVVKAIPPGRVSTYGAVAKVAGGCARSVGGVMRRNTPECTQVP
mmetsp:Transcript_14375/g.42936  ORF Transcript_14375/g.42936 Transcript_14375/m.42936 type:complete len:87 (-) Transcript_14375:627-887(-)